MAYLSLANNIQSLFQTLFHAANSPKMIASSGFLYGFTYALIKGKLLKQPLSTVLTSSIYGMGMSIMTEFISSPIPKNFRFVIPLALLASAIHYYKTFKNLDNK